MQTTLVAFLRELEEEEVIEGAAGNTTRGKSVIEPFLER